MKKMILTCVIYGIVLFVPMFWIASKIQQEPRINCVSEPTTIKAEQDTLDLGNIRYGTTKKAFFRIHNTGPSPLIIHGANSSCGCIEMKWDKEPIEPGAVENISVDFSSNSLGRFHKSIDVFCNTEKGVHKLCLTGNVEEAKNDHTTTK